MCHSSVRYITALVEPPKPPTMVMAFSKALRVIMSLGLMSSNKIRMAFRPRHIRVFCLRSKRDWTNCKASRPNASIAQATMVLAVYIPPQAWAWARILNHSFIIFVGNGFLEFFPRLQKRKRCSGVLLPSSKLSCLP